MRRSLVLALAAWLVPVLAASADVTPPSPAARPAACAPERWPLAVAVGGALSTSGRATGEATFLPDLPGPYVSLGFSESGAGPRAYAEVGMAVVVSLAAGVTSHFEPGSAPRYGFHLFAGVPLPLVGFSADGVSTLSGNGFRIAPLLLYIEPFYRPELRKGVAVEHEVGVLLKVRVALTRRQWAERGYDPGSGIHDL